MYIKKIIHKSATVNVARGSELVKQKDGNILLCTLRFETYF